MYYSIFFHQILVSQKSKQPIENWTCILHLTTYHKRYTAINAKSLRWSQSITNHSLIPVHKSHRCPRGLTVVVILSFLNFCHGKLFHFTSFHRLNNGPTSTNLFRVYTVLQEARQCFVGCCHIQISNSPRLDLMWWKVFGRIYQRSQQGNYLEPEPVEHWSERL